MRTRIIATFSVIFTLIVSCVDGDLPKPPSRILRFGANSLSIDGFSLWAYRHTGQWAFTQDESILIDNTGSGYALVTGNATGTEWSYGSPILWPENKQVTFFAYAPHNAATSVYAPGAPWIPVIMYEVPDAVDDQEDLIISEALFDRIGPTAATMRFHHALSRIEVSAVKSGGLSETVRVTQVEFSNLYNAGTAPLDVPILWTTNGAPTNSYTLSISGGTLLDVAVEDTEASLLSSSESALLLMPQSLSWVAPDLPKMIAVTFTMGGIEFEWEGPIPSPTDWNPGSIYNYTLSISGEVVTVICSELEPAYPGADWHEIGY